MELRNLLLEEQEKQSGAKGLPPRKPGEAPPPIAPPSPEQVARLKALQTRQAADIPPQTTQITNTPPQTTQITNDKEQSVVPPPVETGPDITVSMFTPEVNTPPMPPKVVAKPPVIDEEEVERDRALREDTVKKTFKKEVLAWVHIIVSVGIFAVMMHFFIFVNSTVRQVSMYPTFSDSDRVIAFRLSYLLQEPRVYDVIAHTRRADPDTIFIKRVMGVPGDEIQIIDGAVFRNGVRMYSDFVNDIPIGNMPTVIVPEGRYFVLGDNRNHSIDSRHWPEMFVEPEFILGRVVVRYMPGFTFFFDRSLN